MTLPILLLLLVILLVTILTNQKRIAWKDKLRRVNPGTSAEEFAAPDYVLQQVRNDYLMAVRWMRECALSPWSEQWSGAPYYFAGLHLRRHQKILVNHRTHAQPRYRDVLTAEHRIEVRSFAADGERCLVLDYQTDRNIHTYEHLTLQPCATQMIPSATVIYQMVYDRASSRWKIEQQIQELPYNAHRSNADKPRRIKVTSALPPTTGRDH